MDFNLTDEQAMFRDSVAGFADRELKDGALARAHRDDYPWDVARKMAEAGLIGITTPAADGGAGGTLMDAVIAIQEVAMACPRSADVVQAGNFGAIRVLAQYGTPEQKERVLKPLLQGTALIAVAMTEPGAGSAVTELRTTAVPDGNGWRVSGEKVFTTHGLHATVFLVYVRFGPGVGGIGSVLIERGAEGFSFGKPSRFLSGEDWNTLYFDNVHVGPENVVLGPGGFKRQISGFNVERLGNSARALALGRHAFALAAEHALNRRQFGQPLVNFQGLQWKFAEMKIKAEAAQLLLYRAALGADTGFPSPQDTAIAKVACNRAGFEMANEAMQIMGGTGYSEESLVEYCFRRTRGWMIAGGTIEILLNRIAEGVFDRRLPIRED
jgi:alkylation response protein AidB-like acyl-CoA dehydrogenase